jgi:quinol monooxygenase YgiN
MSVADEVHVFANVTAAPGKEDELRSVLKDLVAETHTEPGVLTYMLHEDSKKPGNFYVFEVYKDQAAADSHMKSPHLATAFAKAGALLGGAPSIVETKVVAGA